MSDGRATKSLDKLLGARVRARRQAMGMSQERLAELVGVTFQQVQKYEGGVNRIAASRLFDVSCALEVPIAEWFEGVTKPCQAKVASDVVLGSSGATELVRLFSEIRTERVRRRVIELVRVLRDEQLDL